MKLTLGALAVLALPAVASELDVFSDDVRVRVVNVDVVVTDRDDRPVTGLSREDFELLVDGEPVEIHHFAELKKVSAAAGGATPAAAAPGDRGVSYGSESRIRRARGQNLNLIIHVDRAYLGPGDLKDLGTALRSFLDDGLEPGDRVMLISADRRLEVLQELTPLTVAVDARLGDELAKPGRGVRIESEYRDILGAIDRTLEDGNDLRARLPGHHTQALLSRINAFSEDAFRDVAVTHDQLERVVTAVAGLPGRNVVLYVGGRLPIQAGQALFSAWRDAFVQSTRWQSQAPGAGGGAGGGELGAERSLDALSAPGANLDAAELFERVAERAGAFGVRIYTLDATTQRSSPAAALARGSRALAGASGGARHAYRESQRIASASVLGELAEASGGRTLGTGRDLARLFDVLRRDLRATYSLGFVPPDEDESRDHRIEVKLRDSPVKKPRLRYRRHYRSRTSDQEAAEETLSALLVGVTANPLRVEVSAGEAAGASEEDGRRIPLAIKVPLAHLGLVAEARSHVGKLTVFVTSGDLEHGASPVRRAVVPVRIPNEEILNVLGRHLEYTLDVEVARGSRSIAVGVRDDVASLLSTVTVPAAASGPPGPAAAPGSP